MIRSPRFLVSTHYSHYDLATFCVNLALVCVQTVAKLPLMHRVRLFGINKTASLVADEDE